MKGGASPERVEDSHEKVGDSQEQGNDSPEKRESPAKGKGPDDSQEEAGEKQDSETAAAGAGMRKWRRCCTRCRPYRGILLAVVSAVLMTSYTTMIKLLQQMDSMQVRT